MKIIPIPKIDQIYISINMSNPPSAMRNSLNDSAHRHDDVEHMHLRDDSPPPEHRTDDYHHRSDSKLSPQALNPLPTPLIFRSFDWYASQKESLTGLDFEGTNRQASRPVNTFKHPELERTLKNKNVLKVGERYFYKMILEDHRESGRLIEIADQYLVFHTIHQGYVAPKVERWEDMHTIWNATGQEELWSNETQELKGKRGRKAKEKFALHDLRSGWKRPEVGVANGERALANTIVTSLDPARSAMFAMTTPDPYNIPFRTKDGGGEI